MNLPLLPCGTSAFCEHEATLNNQFPPVFCATYGPITPARPALLRFYNGILAVAHDATIRAFATAHLTTERAHLALLEDVLPRDDRSRLLFLWRIAGFLTGAIPALLGRNAVFVTIDAVETFVDSHYSAQTIRLSEEDANADLLALLEHCREDEINHRDEARAAHESVPGPMGRT